MRFSKNKYPVLCGLNSIMYSNGKDVTDIIKGFIAKYTPDYKNKVAFVSQRFAEDAFANANKIIPSVFDENGSRYEPSITDGLCYCLMYGNKVLIGRIGLIYMAFQGKNLIGVSFVNEERKYEGFSAFNSKGTELSASHFVIPEVVLMFRYLSDVETKTLPANKKISDFHCVYKSDFDFPVELLTENWYTESIQGHPFVVRGHWRHQPCGKGFSDRKLIWIDKHTKKGIKRGAFKEKNK